MRLNALLLVLDYDTYCKIYIENKLYTFTSVRDLLTYDTKLLIKQVLSVQHHPSFLVIRLGSLRRGIENEKD